MDQILENYVSKISLIGIGSCGASIAKEFLAFEDVYDIVSLDTKSHKFKTEIIVEIPIEYQHHEGYDQLEIDWSTLNYSENNIQIFVSGASDISGVVLQLLKHLHFRKCKTTVFYIKPETKFLSEIQRLQDKVTFGVLQEYARSGIIDMIIFDNAILGQMVGKVAISKYYAAINQKIAHFVHTFNFCSNNAPVFGQRQTFLDITKIGCLGYGSINSDINLFYNLTSTDGEIVFPLEIQYYFLVPQDKIENDDNLMTEIMETVEKEEQKYKSVSYGVYEISSEQDEVTVLVYLRTSKIQNAL